MTKINYPASSPYGSTKQSDAYIGLYQHRSIPADSGDKTIAIGVRHAHRPDLLSYDLYGTPEYWWVFLVRNMNSIRDPIWDLEIGKTVVVPSLDHLRAVIG